jgi:RES domain-containing protein
MRPLVGRFWRAGFIAHEADLLTPARAPEGRWHHGGQRALYLSGSPEGCQVALKVYLREDDGPRAIYPLEVRATRVVDLRRADVRADLGTSLDQMHAFWADLQAQGEPSPTWTLGDRLRDMGADGLLTPSRSRPDLTHLTLFSWTHPGHAQVRREGAPLPWPN